MSTEPGSASSDPADDRGAAWLAYVLHAVGYLTAMIWLSVVGLVINYFKRGDARGGFLDSHHGWLIRTFWYGLLWYGVSLAVLLSSAWPVVLAVLHNPTAPGEWVFAWNTIFSMVGTATLGLIGLMLTWLWLLYRLVRGTIQLANLRPVP